MLQGSCSAVRCESAASEVKQRRHRVLNGSCPGQDPHLDLAQSLTAARQTFGGGVVWAPGGSSQPFRVLQSFARRGAHCAHHCWSNVNISKQSGLHINVCTSAAALDVLHRSFLSNSPALGTSRRAAFPHLPCAIRLIFHEPYSMFLY